MNYGRTLAAAALGLALAAPVWAQNESPKGPAAPPKRLVQPGGTPRPAEPGKQPTEPGEQPKAPANAPANAGQEMAAAMAAMEAAGKPGEHHQHLAPFVGEWAAITKFRMAEEAPWMESPGRSTNRLDWGGRFLISEYSGDMGGEAFTGVSTWGYDNMAREYQATWRDSLSTSLTWFRGTCDQAGKVFTLSGEGVDPMTGKRKAFRQVITVKTPDSHVMEFYDISPSGKTYKNMEITYTRAGASPAKSNAPSPSKP